jgi:hypothetical protein
MRVNVYNEEITDRVELTEKNVNNVTFNGISIYVGPVIEHTPGDDDSSAVTFWVSDEYTRGQLRTALTKALTILDEISVLA